MRQPHEVMAATVRTFRPVYTASRWATVWRGMFTDLADRSHNAPGPPMSNAEAVAFVRAWRDAGKRAGNRSPLWAQYAARAYGWSPPARTYLRRDDAQGAAAFPTVAADDIDAVDLWSYGKDIAGTLDTANVPDARIDVDSQSFRDPVFAGEVRAALQAEGFDAAFKVPLPGCRDKKTGKMRTPYLPCDKNGKRRIPDGRGGLVEAKCDKPGDCEPVMVDDPVTATAKSVWPLVLIVGAVWLLTRQRSRRSERK